MNQEVAFEQLLAMLDMEAYHYWTEHGRGILNINAAFYWDDQPQGARYWGNRNSIMNECMQIWINEGIVAAGTRLKHLKRTL